MRRPSPIPPFGRLPSAAAAVAGVVSAGAGLGVAEVVVAASPRLRSPVLDVGDRVVDLVPVPVKTQAIAWFGTHDKMALLIGIAVLLVAYAAAVGVAFSRRRAAGMVGVALFAGLGAAASQLGRLPRPWWAVAPSLLGGLIALACLHFLNRPGPAAAPDLANRPDLAELAADAPDRADRPDLAGPTGDAPDRADGSGRLEPAAAGRSRSGRVRHPSGPLAPAGMGRRRFLAGVGATAVVSAGLAGAGRRLQERFSAARSRSAVRLPAPAVAALALSPAVSAPVAGVTPFVTPNDAFYRIDTALTVPQVPAETWALDVTGLVGRPLRLSYDELLARPLEEHDVTLTCVSNLVGGNLVGNARWLGARLDDLLAEAGVDPRADQVVGRSVDGYTCGFPLAALDGRPALVAVAMNGEPLPLAHGFPARLIVPGLYGYVSATKWLRAIELTRFDAFDQYWVPRGYAARAPIKLQSRIDTPRPLATVAPGPVALAGVAWAQPVGVAAVEVRVDDGPWRPATLADEASPLTWRQWYLNWDAPPGRHSITVRATDATGLVQTDARTDPLPDGATGQHQIVVQVTAA